MTASDKQTIRTLNRLYRICDAGEKGFSVVAENVNNRGLKLFLKTYAQERFQFKRELRAEIERLGGQLKARRSIRGIIHRGRIDILATLTIGPENIEKYVLGEALRGENAAVKIYEKALRQNLPDETRAVVQRQAERIQAVCQEVRYLRGHEGQRLVVRLFDSEESGETAIEMLQSAGFAEDTIEQIHLVDVLQVYTGRGNTVLETVASGAVGGAIWGGIIGIVAGLGVLMVSGTAPFLGTDGPTTGALVALAGIILGALFGAILGLFIGLGISEEDTYLYEDGLQHGIILLKVRTDRERATQAAQIMRQINALAKAQPAT
jgi:uncharacterized protein (TIGR02284 family)